MTNTGQPDLPLERPQRFPGSHYTYFVVPFAYRRERASESSQLQYVADGSFGTYLSVVDGPSDVKSAESGEATEGIAVPGTDPATRLRARLSYLLPETRLTLFERAKWFQLQQGGEQLKLHGVLTNGAGRDQAFQAEAELVLFEWVRAYGVRKDADDVGLIGFLLLACKLDGEPTLADLLDFNENARYLERPNAPFYRSDLDVWHGEGSERALFFQGRRDSDGRYWPFWHRLIATYNLVDGPDHYRLTIRAPLPRGTDVAAQDAISRGFHPAGYPDDRAFTYTLSCVGDLPPLSEIADQPSAEQGAWERIWHALLDVDTAPALTSPLSAYQRRWLACRGYERWLHTGAIYGYTDFSAALLISADEEAYPYPYYHFHNMYLDQLLLLLYERVALYLCSAAISEASHLRQTDPGQRSFERFHTLREQFTWLTNLYQFPMFTTQYQGQEMQALARRSLNIDGLYGEVATEIAATDQLLAQDAARRRQVATEQLNVQLAKLQQIGLLVAGGAIGLTALQALLALIQFYEIAPAYLFGPSGTLVLWFLEIASLGSLLLVVLIWMLVKTKLSGRQDRQIGPPD